MKILIALERIKEAGGNEIILHPQHPGALLYRADGSTKKISLSVEEVEQFELDASGCQFVVKNSGANGVISYMSTLPDTSTAVSFLVDYYNELNKEGNELEEEAFTVEAPPKQPPVQRTQQSVQTPSFNIGKSQASSLATAVIGDVPKAPDLQEEIEPGYEIQDEDTKKESDRARTEEELTTLLIKDIHSYMSLNSTNVMITVNDNGNFIDDGKVIVRNNTNSRIKAFKKIYNPTTSNGHDFDIKYDGVEYLFRVSSLGEYSSIEVHRDLEKENYTLYPSGDVKEIIEDKRRGGIIVASNHATVLLQPALKMIESVDNKVRENSLAIGDVLPKTEPVNRISETEIQYDKVRRSPYRYIFIDGDVSIDMERIHDLVLGGRIVVIGYTSSTLYGLTTKFSLSIKAEADIKRSVLLSVACFLNPQLSIDVKDRSITLADTELYNMNFNRAVELVDEGITSEDFNTRIEYPAKVHSLTDNLKPVSQEEEFLNLLRESIAIGASDIFIAVGSPIKYRYKGRIHAYNQEVIIKPDISRQVAFLITNETDRQKLDEKGYVDSSYSVPGLSRFRIHICIQRGTTSVVIRPIKFGIPDKTAMRIPPALIEAISEKGAGMVITTGPTGVGKSTTNAILVTEAFNRNPVSLLSIGDPIEFLYQHNKGIVIQREVPTDAPTFEDALESAFRSNPNIIEVGEIRTKEGLEVAMRLGSSGHLFFATMHTGSVMATINTILNRSESSRRGEILETLSESLTAIINQVLVKDVNGDLMPVFEYLILDDYAKRCISIDDLNALEAHMANQAQSLSGNICRLRQVELGKMLQAGVIDQATFNAYSRKQKDEVKPPEYGGGQ